MIHFKEDSKYCDTVHWDEKWVQKRVSLRLHLKLIPGGLTSRHLLGCGPSRKSTSPFSPLSYWFSSWGRDLVERTTVSHYRSHTAQFPHTFSIVGPIFDVLALKETTGKGSRTDIDCRRSTLISDIIRKSLEIHENVISKRARITALVKH